jgi:hypothetical protein
MLQAGDLDLPSTLQDDDQTVFEVPYEVRNGQPTGKSVLRGNDGKRFIYLRWLVHSGERVTPYGRMKLFFEDFHEGASTITVGGTDTQGRPRCARVRPLD